METRVEQVSFDQDYNAVVLKGISYDNRQNVHIIFLIDVSDSMNDASKIDQVKKSIQFLLTILQDNDYISLITFGDESKIVFQTLPMTQDNKEVVKQRVENLHTEGCTNLSAGLMNIQSIPVLPSTIKAGVLLLTDGHANVGVSSSQGLEGIVNHLLQNVNPSLSISTVGYGVSHNANLLQEIATVGSGSYNIVNNLEEIATIFGEVFGGLSTVVAQNVSVELPDNTIPLTGYHVENHTIKIGDVYSENEIILFYTSSDPSLPVKIKFDNMIDYSHHEQNIIPLLNNVNQPSKNIVIAFYRFKVSSLLKKIVSEGANDELKQEAQELIDRLNQLEFREDLIIQMLLDDCEKVVSTNHITPTQAVNYLQHSAYFSLGRGNLASATTEAHDENDSDEGEPFTQSGGGGFIMNRTNSVNVGNFMGCDSEEENPVIVQSAARRNFSSVQSPFSNRMQSRHSEAMRTLSNQHPE